jgi:hypothetical protein
MRLKDTSVGQEHGIDAHEQGHPLPAVRLPSLAKEHVENRSTPRAKRSLSRAQCQGVRSQSLQKGMFRPACGNTWGPGALTGVLLAG